ncbi:uncharacterized protein [Fopius arisanus]|nr:PREDICTED: uncharacterized protein LOC105271060 isoform X1 [Fopius arisanus]XP_011310687.1 PREDICTED: uncharacterized protein LOC105271060 isoform X1 [Fopius arisanus]XP_011310688.1 PREDICTED: uncharacterized protein LOC105271060 isoform X1 [Fopius arisanus]
MQWAKGGGNARQKGSRRRSLFRSPQKSCSDSEVARIKFKERKGKSKDQFPWPSVYQLTVDELARYRRRRVPNRPDTLGVDHYEDALESLVTEYRRAFRATSEDSLVKRNIGDSEVEAGDLATIKANGGPMETDNDASALPGHVSTRPPLIRKGTSLKTGGNFYSATEYSNYRTYEGLHRPELARRPTSLRMEGDMRTVTEQCEKFIEWFNVSRPDLVRVPTHLKLEGQQETSTESHEQYVPFVGARRPEILRQGAHLKLEGETTYLPEYTDVFRQPIHQEKRSPLLPETHLKSGGNFSQATENTQQFVDPRGTVVPPNDNDESIEDLLELDNHHKKEEDMNLLVSKLSDLKHPPMETPEYKDAYRDFPRERPKLLKPEDEIGRADGSKVHPSSGSATFRTKIDQDPEYKSKYIDPDRPIYRKPPISMRHPIGSSGFDRRLVPDLRSHTSTSEVRAQYVPHGHVPKVESLRMPPTLRPEGHMNLQPEYRDAYCRRGSRINDPTHQATRRKSNNWLNNDNSEQFGSVNAQNDQDAFQVLQTRVHEENVVGKPPMVRRSSRASQGQRPSIADVNPQLLTNRSPSPTYRLHVHNVDDEPRGFARRRRTSSIRQTGNSPSPDRATFEDNQRSYSPSFGKERQSDEAQAFVVLDNANVHGNDSRRRRLDRNSNFETLGERRKRTPPNWMPPWYDNASTI